MEIFDIFRSKPETRNQQHEPKDERKAECPNCQKKLSKIPGAKTKCPHCGDFMYVRTRTDNVRVVVTKSEADKIDEAWRIENGTQEVYLAEQKRFNDRKELLQKKFGGKEPSENDVRWGLLNEDLLKNAKSEQWGLYRNVKFQMAEILNKENKLKDALRMYLEVCYLDLNGATNMPTDENGNVVRDPEYFKPFDPKESAFLAPGVIDLIKRIVLKINLSKDETKQIFVEHNSRSEKSLRLPVSAEQAWLSMDKEL